MKKLYSNKFHILIFLLPALILFCGVLIAPIGASAYFSLFDWKGIGPKTFIGLANYKELFTSNSIGFMKALGNSLLLAALSVCLQLPLALALALALGKKIRGERAFLREIPPVRGRSGAHESASGKPCRPSKPRDPRDRSFALGRDSADALCSAEDGDPLYGGACVSGQGSLYPRDGPLPGDPPFFLGACGN